MNSKKRKLGWGLIGAVGCAAIFTLVVTVFYPYSAFSLYKTYPFKPYKVVFDESKTYEQLVKEFKASYEKDLEAEMDKENMNKTVTTMGYILPNFDQDWLVSRKPVRIDKARLEGMLLELQEARETLLDLIVTGDCSEEQRGELAHVVNYIASMESDMQLTKDGNLTRKQTKTMLGNLYGDYMSFFEQFTSFYNEAVRENEHGALPKSNGE